MHCYYCTKITVPGWASTGPLKPDVIQGAREESSVYARKELPRVDRSKDPVEDEKSQLLSFSEILFEFCSILIKVYKNLHYTEFHSLL